MDFLDNVSSYLDGKTITPSFFVPKMWKLAVIVKGNRRTTDGGKCKGGSRCRTDREGRQIQDGWREVPEDQQIQDGRGKVPGGQQVRDG